MAIIPASTVAVAAILRIRIPLVRLAIAVIQTIGFVCVSVASIVRSVARTIRIVLSPFVASTGIVVILVVSLSLVMSSGTIQISSGAI